MEDRQLLASVTLNGTELVIQGNPTDDTISLISNTNQPEFTVSVAGEPSLTATYNNADITKVTVFAGAGNDYVANTIQVPTAIRGQAGNDTLRGGYADDIINGGNGNDNILGRTGNDLLNGQGDDDVISGGSGDDTITGGNGNDTITGGEGNDAIYGEGGADLIYGQNGNDNISGGSGADEIRGGNGDDGIDGGAGDDFLLGQNDNDTIIGGAGNDHLHGGAQNDTLNGQLGADLLNGHLGDDLLIAGDDSEVDKLYGGTGYDQFTLQGEVGNGSVDQVRDRTGTETYAGLDPSLLTTSVELADNVLTVRGLPTNDHFRVQPINSDQFELWVNGERIDTYHNVDINQIVMFGGAGDDRVINDGSPIPTQLHGQAGNDRLDGGSGDDEINGGTGNDRLFGHAGADQLRGQSGDDFLVSGGDQDADQLTGGTGFDEFLILGTVGVDSVDQVLDRFGMETYNGYAGPLEASIELDGNTISVVGSNDNDKYIVDDKFNDGTTLRIERWHSEIGSYATADIDEVVFHLNDGNDLLFTYENEVTTPIRAYGGNGDDEIEGGNGNDLLIGDDGNDRLYGRGGDDTISGFNGNDRISGGDGNDQLNGNTGDDRIGGDSGDDEINGGEGNDLAGGGDGNDFVGGNAGNDRLYGDQGNDTVRGDAGADDLFGNLGNDLLLADDIDRVVSGGAGTDTVTANGSGDNGTDDNGTGNDGTGSIGDRVFEDLDNDMIFDAGESGVEGIMVQLLQNSEVVANQTTNDQGIYRFDSLAAGTYTVQLLSDSLDTRSITTSATVDVTLGVDEQNLAADFGVTAPVIDSTNTGSIGDLVYIDENENGVFDAGEVGLEGVEIQLIQSTTVIATTTTDANGNYTFSNLAPSDFLVEIQIESIGERIATTDAAVNVTLNEGQARNGVDFGFSSESIFGDAAERIKTTATVFQSDSIPASVFNEFESSLDAKVSMTRIDEFMILEVDSSKYVFRETMIDGEMATQFYNEFSINESSTAVVDSFDIALRATGDAAAAAAAAAASNFTISGPFAGRTTAASIYPIFRPVLPGPFQPPTPRPNLDLILNAFQVTPSPTAAFDPSWFTGARTLTVKEIFVLEQLRQDVRLPAFLEFFDGQEGLRPMFAIESLSRDLPFVLYPGAPAEVPAHSKDEVSRAAWIENDGHHDAFRHAFLGAQLTQSYGRAFAETFTMAHEEIGSNVATREAMDLYNNSIGIRIASQNPGAGRKAVGALIRQAITNGEMIVIDGNGNLAWSDEVELHDHGTARNSATQTLPGVLSSPIAVPPTFTPPPATVVPSTGSLIDSFLP